MNRRYLLDLAERVGATFLEGAGATFATLGPLDLHGIDSLEKTGLAAVAGGLASVGALCKGLLAKRVGDPESASLVVGSAPVVEPKPDAQVDVPPAGQ